jgi:hypothetical protein
MSSVNATAGVLLVGIGLDLAEDLHPRDLAALAELGEFLGDVAAGTKAGEVS